VDDTAGVVGDLNADDRVAAIRELLRIIRPGGRAMIIGSAPRTGIAKLFSGGRPACSFAISGDANTALESSGFKLVRTLAARDGLVFVEGLKRRAGQAGGAG
jgi:hypothetical protein